MLIEGINDLELQNKISRAFDEHLASVKGLSDNEADAIRVIFRERYRADIVEQRYATPARKRHSSLEKFIWRQIDENKTEHEKVLKTCFHESGTVASGLKIVVKHPPDHPPKTTGWDLLLLLLNYKLWVAMSALVGTCTVFLAVATWAYTGELPDLPFLK